MSSEYLTEYQIPLAIMSADVRESSPPVSSHQSSGSSRFHPPGRDRETTTQDVIPVVPVASPRTLKRKLNEVQPPPPLTASTMSGSGGGAGESNNVVMFQGRDQSYPDELNKLIQPLSCQLCKSQMTSMKSAKDHYESKSHDRHISAWLAKNYTEAGLQTPPVKRLVKEGPTGPNAFHCTLCDLALTSKTHARQHYAGRKHQLVEQRRSKPSGAGYYNTEGNWVRTGSKAEPGVSDDGRFGIGELFLSPRGDVTDNSSTSISSQEPRPIEVMTTNGRKSKAEEVSAATTAVLAEGLMCKICKISVTSASQIKMHMDGAKHQKNLRKQMMEDDSSGSASSSQLEQQTMLATVDLNNDYLLYRTPSGSYYCKLCNKAMNHISILQQHLQGKKHLKTVRQQIDKGLTS